MSWLLFTGMGLFVALLLVPPLLHGENGGDAELADYFAQLDALDARDDLEPDMKQMTRTTLERQILARRDALDTTPSRGVLFGIPVAFFVLSAALHAVTAEPRPAGPPPADDVSDLLAQLEARLAGPSADDPQGWRLYARMLASLERRDEAVAAYDRFVVLSGNHPDAVAERDAALATLARGPSARDVEAAQDLSPEDRAAMIESMVDGLSARLASDPRDPAGWTRLIRARLVLGQRDVAAVDVDRLRAAYADEPQTVAAILQGAGWDVPDTP